MTFSVIRITEPLKEVHMKIGDKAPLFTLPDQNGHQISLKDYLDKKSVVLFFYPKDDTPG